MAAISLKLPDDLARESKRVAERLGISRTELIRRALRHELAAIEARLEREAMAAAFSAMREDPRYREHAEELDEGLSESMAAEPEGWWRG
ncbi:MAG TPA: ribbon-helix-helix protein, CopG family [Thiotrichales bacterium]|nr:ribbon-helix-helix protein, CopG family [Thiotrichales bacterium]